MSDEPAATSPTPAAVSELYGDALGTIEAYVSVLATRGVEWGLIGPREVPRLWERHVLNSVAIAGLIAGPRRRPARAESAAGRLPHPDHDELGLGDRVRVVRARAEEHRATYDVVTCRAVAPLGQLLGWTSRLFLPDGELLALKGASAEDEVAASRRELVQAGAVATVVSARAHEEAEPTYVVRVRRKS